MFTPNARPNWEQDGRDWPHRQASRFVHAGGIEWHVQIMGKGPVALLVHGTGSATHSWRDVMPQLAEQYTVVAMDLPGHGFSATPLMHRLSLPAMARMLGDLVHVLGVKPQIAVGHSAGAAILARACLDHRVEPRLLVSLNGALLPFRGMAGQVFPYLARLLFLNPLAPRLFAWSANDGERVQRLITDTGSSIDAKGLELYTRLFRRSGHVVGALSMMAHWDLEPLKRELPRLKPHLLLVVGDKDGAVPPADAMEIAAIVPGASRVVIPELGHLAHEEAPARVVDLILSEARAFAAA